MRIDSSEPECSTCFHSRTSGIRNAHVMDTTVNPTPVISEPNNVIASSSNPIPVSSEPAQSLGSKVAFGSFGASTIFNSTTSSVSSSPIKFGSTPPQSLNQTNFGYEAFSGFKPPRTESIQAPVQASRSFSFATPHQDFGKTASMFGNGVGFARTDIGYTPNHLVPSSTNTVMFGTTPVSVSSVCNPTTPKNPFNFGSSSSIFGPIPRFGVASSLFGEGSMYQRPQETVCCKTCGATTKTISSSATTTPPSSVATSGNTNLAAQGKNPGLETFGKNLASQGTQTPEVEDCPMVSTTNLAAQATTTRAFQAYPTRSHWDDFLLRSIITLLSLVCFLLVLIVGLLLLFSVAGLNH